MMNKKKVLTSLVLGTAMVSQVAVPVFAKEQTNETPKQDTTAPNEWKADSHTTIGISEISAKDAAEDGVDKTQNVSFEVPLYVTTAAIAGKADLKTPTEYDITNSGNRGIVVTAMQIEKLGDWNTVSADPTTNREVKLSIGGREMPATNDQNKKVAVEILKQGSNSAFNTDMKYNVIKKQDAKTKVNGSLAKADANTGRDATVINKDDNGNVLGLNISGKIQNDTARKTKGAAAQFKVTYTVSAIIKDKDTAGDATVDKDGIVGYTYVGDDKAAAQLK